MEIDRIIESNSKNLKKRADPMKSLSVMVGVLFIGLMILGYTEVWGVDWELLQKMEDIKFYYDKKDGTLSPLRIVKVWVRQVYTKKDVIDIINLLGSRLENLSYSINSLEFICETELTRFLSITYFSDNGDLLALGDITDKWESIPPNSMFDALYKIVCKQMEKKVTLTP